MKTFVIGDIHGNYKALMECVEKSKFNSDVDTLISLGDVCDGHNQVYDVISYLLSIKNLILIKGNHDCISLDTHILTKSGWKTYDTINLNDHVLSFDINRGVGSWQVINNIILKKNNDRQLFNIESKKLDILVTGNHRILNSKRSNNKIWGSYSFTRMKDLNGRIKIPINCLMESYDSVKYNDSEIALCAWILTDSHITLKYEYVTIYQSKPYYVNYVRQLLYDNRITFKENTREMNVDMIKGKKIQSQLPCVEFKFNSIESKKILSRLNINQRKNLPAWIYNLNVEQFTLFLKNIIFANGTFYNRGNEFTSILYGRYEFLLEIQIACILHNISATLVYDNRGDPRLNISNQSSIQFDVIKKVKTVNNNDLVWCISTPMENFMAMRNGKPFFTGNSWALNFIQSGWMDEIWTWQGGKKTIDSYRKALRAKSVDKIRKLFPPAHRALLESAVPYYIDSQNRIFVHGGFDERYSIEEQSIDVLLWNRDLVCKFGKPNSTENIPGYKLVFTGHTTSSFILGTFTTLPIIQNNLICLDTGAGYDGKLTIMDVDTLEYWQSNNVARIG